MRPSPVTCGLRPARPVTGWSVRERALEEPDPIVWPIVADDLSSPDATPPGEGATLVTMVRFEEEVEPDAGNRLCSPDEPALEEAPADDELPDDVSPPDDEDPDDPRDVVVLPAFRGTA